MQRVGRRGGKPKKGKEESYERGEDGEREIKGKRMEREGQRQ